MRKHQQHAGRTSLKAKAIVLHATCPRFIRNRGITYTPQVRSAWIPSKPTDRPHICIARHRLLDYGAGRAAVSTMMAAFRPWTMSSITMINI